MKYHYIAGDPLSDPRRTPSQVNGALNAQEFKAPPACHASFFLMICFPCIFRFVCCVFTIFALILLYDSLGVFTGSTVCGVVCGAGPGGVRWTDISVGPAYASLITTFDLPCSFILIYFTTPTETCLVSALKGRLQVQLIVRKL